MSDDWAERVPEDAAALLQRYARALFKYERLMEISRRLSSTLKLDSLLEHIVLAASELTGTEAASILLVDKLTGVLRFEAAVDNTGFKLSSIEVPVEGSIAGWVVTHGEPLLIADVTADARFYSGADDESGFRTRNILAVPMSTRDKVIGCLEAVNKHGEAPFSDEDLSTLNTLSAQAAIAIENARLFEQSDLIAEMVHELRTPLAAIKATTHILGRPEISADKREQMLVTVAGETDRLTRMTTEFLDLARLESGRTRLQETPVQLGDVLRQAVETVRPQAGDKNVSIQLELAPTGLPPVMGDDEKLKQVALNLLTNAIKYNRADGVVTVRAATLEDAVEVSVIDTGFGISPENLPHIFEKFYRVADTEGYTQGTGLGLAITKRIVEGHGGEIAVSSIAGVGTTFTFRLPVRKSGRRRAASSAK
ncbi:MAG: GAF domain-containing sensor histidine kinase [Anaerolineae bacterium]|nr:GAF domain-containing sensor histidine kinase [Anaerolineae bacterium]